MSDESNRPAMTPPSGGFEFNRPTIIGLLYAGSYITGVSGLIGLVLAYVWRGEAHEPWEATHYTYLVRTFWIGLIAGVIGFITLIIGIGFLILLAVGVWTLVRIVLSLINAQKRAPMADPQTLFF
jgi:uncharacterized membrane protein